MNRIYNLEEFTEQNQIDGLFGSALVCFTADRDFLRRVVHPGIGSFYSVNLIVDGWEDYIINRNQIHLEMHDLFVKQPYDNISVKSCPEEVSSIHLLVERNMSGESKSTRIFLSETISGREKSIFSWSFKVFEVPLHIRSVFRPCILALKGTHFCRHDKEKRFFLCLYELFRLCYP